MILLRHIILDIFIRSVQDILIHSILPENGLIRASEHFSLDVSVMLNMSDSHIVCLCNWAKAFSFDILLSALAGIALKSVCEPCPEQCKHIEELDMNAVSSHAPTLFGIMSDVCQLDGRLVMLV